MNDTEDDRQVLGSMPASDAKTILLPDGYAEPYAHEAAWAKRVWRRGFSARVLGTEYDCAYSNTIS